jgi:hypothetical protein
MTYKEIAAALFEKGNNLADAAVDLMRGLIEEETGILPDRDETAPEWVIVSAGLNPRTLYI